MIPYLLWLCHRRKKIRSKYGTRSQLKSCKMDINGHDESIQNVLFCVELQASPVFSWSTHQHEAWGCCAKWWWRWCRYSISPILTPEGLWSSINIDKSKVPVTVSMKINANPASATSIAYVFIVVNVVNVLWDEMVWLFLLHVFTCLVVCLSLVCLPVHKFVWIHDNVHVWWQNN